MAEDNLQLSSEQNLDAHIITLFQRLESLRRDGKVNHYNAIGGKCANQIQGKFNMQAELRTLEFWRSILAECLASFLYVFIVCGAAAGAGVGASISSVLLSTALASGFAIATVTQCFSHLSGAHVNPAVTLAMMVIRLISPLRGTMYIIAQCGGSIAGAALLYSVTVPGYQGNLQAAITQSASLHAWERLGIELILTFVVVLVYFMSTDSYKRYFGSSPLAIGAAYSACSFVSMPYLNPARSLGPSFVLHKWDNHWVYWIGPLVGGALSGLLFKYVFNCNNDLIKSSTNSVENDSSSIQSDDDINYDLDLEKPSTQQKLHGSTYRSPTGGGLNQQNIGYCQSVYSTNGTKLDHTEPLYGGTRSMYCKSPPLTRANLNRSQSVYAKSNTALNRDQLARSGSLVPAQSLYPLRVTQTQNSHLQNQNVQNQLQQRSESTYGIRGQIRNVQERPLQDTTNIISFQPTYGTRTNPSPGDGQCKYDLREITITRDDQQKFNTRSNRPESIHGGISSGARRGLSTQSDDSSYGSYHGPQPPPPSITPPTRNQPSQNQPTKDMHYNSQQTVIRTNQQQQQHHQQNTHQQPERKISSSASDRQTYSTVKSGQQQQQQQQLHQQQQQSLMSSGSLPHSYSHAIRQN